MKSGADPLRAGCELTRDFGAALSGIKWASRLAIRNAKIKRRATIATLDSPSYPVSKMDWFQ
jgi:hypothetical protein